MMKLRIRFIILLLVLTINIIPALAVENGKIKEGEILSLADCVGIAINNSPVIKKYEYNLQVAKSNVGIAKSAYFPTLGAGVGIYQEYNSNKLSENTSSARELPSAGIYLQQLIWDFGKTNSLIKMERFYKLAAEYEFMDSICNTIYNVKMKYFNVLNTKAILEVEKTNELLNRKNVERTKQLYESGKKNRIDYIDAKVFLSDAEMRVSDAENKYDIALADLANAMYSAYAPDFEVEKLYTFNFNDTFIPDYVKQEAVDNNIKNVALKTKVEMNEESQLKVLPFNLKEAYDLAFRNSPDLWVLETTVNAMKQALIYAKRQYYPAITGNVGYNYLNAREYSNHDFNMYIDMTASLNIKQLKHEIDRAQANVNLAENDVYEFKQNLYFEVKKCFLNVDKNEDQIYIAKQQAEEALEDFNLANRRYEEGRTDYIALQQARKNYNDAKLLYVKMLYEYNVSLADLEIAMHYHLDDLHAQAEHALHYHYSEILDKLESAIHCDHREEEESKNPNKGVKDNDL